MTATTEVDTGRNRVRGIKNAQRSAVVRERILDHLLVNGGRISHERMQDAREDFCRAAIRCAQENGMRIWKDATHTQLEGALSSIAVLLGEKEVISSRTGGAVRRTGVNAAWVLDIWEATLNKLHREPIIRRGPQPIEDGHASVEDIAAMNGKGVCVVAVPEPEASLSSRVLDAYLARDDESMMRLAIEIERLER